MPSDSEIRAAFEAWSPFSTSRCGGGYLTRHAQTAWRAWQAAWEAVAEDTHRSTGRIRHAFQSLSGEDQARIPPSLFRVLAEEVVGFIVQQNSNQCGEFDARAADVPGNPDRPGSPTSHPGAASPAEPASDHRASRGGDLMQWLDHPEPGVYSKHIPASDTDADQIAVEPDACPTCGYAIAQLCFAPCCDGKAWCLDTFHDQPEAGDAFGDAEALKRNA